MTALATSSASRSVWLGRRRFHHVSEMSSPVARDDSSVAVHELVLAQPVEQRRELVGVPTVVLVGHGDELGIGGHELERALEVVVEAEPPRGPRHDEARVLGHLLQQRPVARRARAVVTDDAHPVAVRLLPDRLQLGPQELARRVVGGHGHGDPGAGAARPVHGERRLRRGQRHRAELGGHLAAVCELGPQGDGDPLRRARHHGCGPGPRSRSGSCAAEDPRRIRCRARSWPRRQDRGVDAGRAASRAGACRGRARAGARRPRRSRAAGWEPGARSTSRPGTARLGRPPGSRRAARSRAGRSGRVRSQRPQAIRRAGDAPGAGDPSA